jgi:hypothetical protein
MATAYELAGQRLARSIPGTMYKTAEAAKLGIDVLLAQ